MVGLVRVGEEAEIEVQRRNESITLSVTIAELDDAESGDAPRINTSGDPGLGVTIGQMTAGQREQIGSTGVLIEKVEPGSVAAEAGIRSGDVLMSFNQTDITSAKQLRQLVKTAPKGKPVPVLIVRNNQPLFSALTVR